MNLLIARIAHCRCYIISGGTTSLATSSRKVTTALREYRPVFFRNCIIIITSFHQKSRSWRRLYRRSIDDGDDDFSRSAQRRLLPAFSAGQFSLLPANKAAAAGIFFKTITRYRRVMTFISFIASALTRRAATPTGFITHIQMRFIKKCTRAQ